MTTSQGKPSAKALQILEALQQAVTEELERKRRLGHYAVFWIDGKIVTVGEDAPPEDAAPPHDTSN